MFEIIDQAPQEGAIIKVIGVGGCGGNAVEHMILKGLSGVDFIVANTDAQALKRSTARTQLQLGSALTRGLGAGARPEIGRDAAMEDRDRIAEMIDGADMLFITAGHGRRDRHRRGADHRRHREEHGRADRRGRHAPVPLRGQAPEGGAGRHRGARQARRLAHHHPEREARRGARAERLAARGLRVGERRAARRRVGHRRGHQQPGARQRRLRGRPDRDGRGRHGDDGIGDRRRATSARARPRRRRSAARCSRTSTSRARAACSSTSPRRRGSRSRSTTT